MNTEGRKIVTGLTNCGTLCLPYQPDWKKRAVHSYLCGRCRLELLLRRFRDHL